MDVMRVAIMCFLMQELSNEFPPEERDGVIETIPGNPEAFEFTLLDGGSFRVTVERVSEKTPSSDLTISKTVVE